MKISSLFKKNNDAISSDLNKDIDTKTNEKNNTKQQDTNDTKNEFKSSELDGKKTIQQRLVDDLVKERDEYKQKYLELSNAIQTQTDFSQELNDASLDVLKYWEECKNIYHEGLEEIHVLKTRYTKLCNEMAQMKIDYQREMDELLKQAREDLIEE